MKSLELINYKLVELNASELLSIEGGNWLTKGIKNLAIAIKIAVSDAYNGFVDDYNAGQAEHHSPS